MPAVKLRQLAATSPSVNEMLRACPLRALLSRDPALAPFSLGNPKAWLGTAYHQVLERVASHPPSGSPEDTIRILWDAAVAAQHERASGHPLNRRYGAPETWPGFYVTRAAALLRGRELLPNNPVPGPLQSATAPPAREHSLLALGGKLVGRPDVVRVDEIIDYKSGPVVEFDAETQASQIRVAYARQLRLYGFLVQQNFGVWPSRGVLLPALGQAVELALVPDECEREALDAVKLLDECNAAVLSGAPPAQVARPSPNNCRWCPHKLYCAAFWEHASPDWTGRLDGAALAGHLVSPPQPIHSGAAVSIHVQMTAGSEPLRSVHIAPLNPLAHPVACTVPHGAEIVMTGLRTRPDGALSPGQRTLLFRREELPIIEPSECT